MQANRRIGDFFTVCFTVASQGRCSETSFYERKSKILGAYTFQEAVTGFEW